MTFETPGGQIQMTREGTVFFTLPELFHERVIQWKCQVNDGSLSTFYQMIIGRDLLEKLGIDISFSQNMIKWDHADIPMSSPNISRQHMFLNEGTESRPAVAATQQIKHILDAKYEKADLPTCVKG